MKIRTKEQLQDCLSEDLGWRKRELSNLYNDVRTANSKKLDTALRCAVVLLYAHWEGFIKNAAEYYLTYIKFQKLNLDQVNSNILALSLKQKLKEFDSTNKATYHVQFIEYLKGGMSDKAIFSETDSIKTASNLNFVVLEEILSTIGVDFSPYELKSNLIDSQLLNYRNTIAHGNYLPLDKTEYENMHVEIISMLTQFYNDISNACVLEKFRA